MSFVDVLTDRADARAPLVHLLGWPCLSQRGVLSRVAEGGTRLLAYLALNRGPNNRGHVAAALWPDVEDGRAAGNLRSALWRLNATLETPIVTADKHALALVDTVDVDVHLIGQWAARLISGRVQPTDVALVSWDVERLVLLPGWYDDWVLLERERLRQRLLHGLECLSRQLSSAGRHAEAVETALAVVSAEPLRESAQRVLVEAHLAEGNRCEALRRFEEHRALVRQELGVEPSPDLAALVQAPAALHHTTAVRPGTRRAG
jgi:DNA-binding SARP family transcriptional activator